MLSELAALFALWAFLSTLVFLIQVLWIFYSTPLTVEGVSRTIEALVRLLVNEFASPRAILSAVVGAIFTAILKLFRREGQRK